MDASQAHCGNTLESFHLRGKGRCHGYRTRTTWLIRRTPCLGHYGPSEAGDACRALLML